MEVLDRFERLLKIMAQLRGEGGCPWDREQTHQSLQPYAIEEAHEVVEAIDEGDPKKLQEELGDLLLQVVFHAQLGEEAGTFAMKDVVEAINQKLIRRHPHVFRRDETKHLETADDVFRNWTEIKNQEGRKRILEGIPKALPALLRASRTGEKAASVGFDWSDAASVEKKVREELKEFKEASPADREEEFGDLLFALVQWARHLKLDAESSLRRATEKFDRRFRVVEDRVTESGKPWSDFSPEELDQLWNSAKRAR